MEESASTDSPQNPVVEAEAVPVAEVVKTDTKAQIDPDALYTFVFYDSLVFHLRRRELRCSSYKYDSAKRDEAPWTVMVKGRDGTFVDLIRVSNYDKMNKILDALTAFQVFGITTDNDGKLFATPALDGLVSEFELAKELESRPKKVVEGGGWCVVG